MGKNTNAPQGAVKPFGALDKLGYAMGDMGCGFSFQLVSTFMQLFYLQYIGLKAEDYAIIILLSKAFDAVNDIVIGCIRTTAAGKQHCRNDRDDFCQTHPITSVLFRNHPA